MVTPAEGGSGCTLGKRFQMAGWKAQESSQGFTLQQRKRRCRQMHVKNLAMSQKDIHVSVNKVTNITNKSMAFYLL